MNVGLIILRVASERRDAQNERELLSVFRTRRAEWARRSCCSAPSHQQLHRSSGSVAAAAPSQQHYNL